MKKNDVKYYLAPFGVAFGLAVWIALCSLAAAKFGLPSPSEILGFLPRTAVVLLGVILICIWLPVFVAGFHFLGRRGAVGQADTLVVEGIYKYVRNPMYAGVSFCLLGVGLALDKTGVLLAGVVWFAMAFLQCRREEVELTERFGREYIDYRNRTPRFIPRFGRLFKDKV